MSYYKKAAEILTKVFTASRLDAEVTPEMVELLIREQDLEKERSPRIMKKIKDFLQEDGYECSRDKLINGSGEKEVILSGRIKTIVSAMYNLLAPKNGNYQDLNDMIGMMIICEDKEACYDIYNMIMKKFKETGDTVILVKDMIREPKKNGYQSIHVHIVDSEGIIFEVQIKSYKMFAFSQTGDCKHELYKRRLDESVLNEEEWIIFDSLREEYWL